MKHFIGIFLVVLLLAGCVSRELSTEPDYDSIISYIMKNQKKESAELYTACEQVLPEIIQKGEIEDYQKVVKIYNKNTDIFSKAMTLGFLASEQTDNPILKDSIFAAVKRANIMTGTDEFLVSAKEYYQERNFTEEELNDRLTAYRAMVSDGYAQLLIERQQLTEALNVYEDIINDYKDTEILLNYGKALNKMNRYEASLIACIEALKMTPGSLDAKAEIMNTAELLGYSKAEVNTMIDETVFVGRNILRQNLLADQLNIPMPEFEIEGLDSTSITHEKFENKILIVSFFATWCPPCLKELPHMNEVYHQYKEDEEVEIIVVSTDRDKFLVPPFINENGYDFPVYYADGLNKAFGVKGIPTLFVIDKLGMTRYKKVGFSEGEEFGKIMSWYIDEIKAAKDA
ncbi:MAG: TlpA disulfide reductase family protein [Candidatus Marinimicrobia bacterium]|nr:TlpA disulfide reductase family protein [Candidatus Neomarinimicrobiota bacterium]